ncbi:MAG: NTP transferase domain-containing protein [Myxococcota bacterium]
MSRAIILAAGKGTRLVSGRPYPKPLERVLGVSLIERIVRSLADANIRDIGIVTGHLGEVLRAEVKAMNLPAKITFFENDEYDKPNGTSLLKAADFVTGPTYLLMSDHLWSPSLIRAVSRFPLAHDAAVLGVDYNVKRCFDIDDATKVCVRGDRVVNIHKQLMEYDCLDTGVFRITPALIEALREHNDEHGVSLSEGVAALAERGKMRTVSVGDAAWIDVDTPDAHAEAERLLSLYGPELQKPRAIPAQAFAV